MIKNYIKKEGSLACLIVSIELVEKSSLAPLKSPGSQSPFRHPNIQARRDGVKGYQELCSLPDTVKESQEPYTCHELNRVLLDECVCVSKDSSF